MKKILLIAVLLMYALTGFSKNEVINVGNTFSPSTITINPGENLTFTLESMHNAVEVSKATYDANGTTPLAGGFSVPFGGGEILPAQLPNGTHYYVCTTHVADGMKGIVIVGTPTGISESQEQIDISVYPNPASDFITIKTSNNLAGSQYFISDQKGRQILTGKINEETVLINISQFEKGMYLFRLGGQKVRPVKLIKN